MQFFAQFFVGCTILALVTCAPVYNSDLDRDAKSLADTRSINPDGNYYYRFNVDNGITQEVKGILQEINGEKFYSVTGSYSYRLDNQRDFKVQYIADENGFRILSLKPEYRFFNYRLPDPVINPKAVASLLSG